MGGVPTEDRFLDLTNEQWVVLIKHNINRQNDQHEVTLGYIEYLATLISPHPRETIKAIEARHKHAQMEKAKAGEDVEREFKLFHEDHRNTTYFDAIAAEGGADAIEDLKQFFGDKPETAQAVELYQPKADDIEFIEKAINKKVDEEVVPTDPLNFDTIEF